MVSPMREKRAWPPRDKDADGETFAAFEAAVAVVKETVVRSGEVLVSAKEDLSDHQRWLKVQTAAVAADRERHDRWLLRQRERQEALERREQKRSRRRAMRQAAAASVTNALARAVHAVGSAVRRFFGTIISGLNYTDGLAASGLRWIGASLRNLLASVAAAFWGGVLYVGRAAGGSALFVASFFVAAASQLAGKVRAAAPSIASGLSLAFGGLAARAHDVSRGAGRGLAAGFSVVASKAGAVTQRAGATLAPAMHGASTRAYALAPSLFDKFGEAGQRARHHAGQGAARLRDWLPMLKVPPVQGENALSLPRRLGGFELSQMLIIAGALLLVCGGLMLGSGLMLRAGTPSKMTAAASPSEPIGWLFEHKTFPIAERSIFITVKTAEGVRIKGFAIGGVNLSNEPLRAMKGVMKPDRHGEELDLETIVGKPGDETGGAPQTAVAEMPSAGIPPQAPFKLVFMFQAEPGGMTPAEVVSGSGGLLLKVHYELGGKEKSFIQYLHATLLEEQLAELVAEAKGS
jgi:hypothetical protein